MTNQSLGDQEFARRMQAIQEAAAAAERARQQAEQLRQQQGGTR
ncbi:hypothetical protein [Streptomyces sp. TLI_171]|nr:hypothetical protein [Streptomyces sp. TLI_171]